MFTWSGLIQGGEEIATAPDFRVWSDVEARGEDVDADQVVHLEAKYSEALGRYYVSRFSVESTADDVEVNGSMLRELRIHESLREALSGSLDITLSNGDLYDDEQPHMAAAHLREAGPSSEESMLAVARVYRAAQIANRPAAKAVASILGLTAPTATLWIRRARSLGLMGAHADG